MRYLFLFCVAVTVCATAASAASAANAPSAIWPDLRYEFKPVVDGTSVTHDIIVQNRGASELRIRRVETG
ncbi:MAG: hypothetical protein LJE65_17045 [Desulfobacteraceae bacterium]|jgi:hypothetical protein|nr:hypothetical protein [Desulfobacteraceae bacterium]